VKGRFGKRGSTVEGETSVYITERATVREKLFLKVVGNTELDTHTHTNTTHTHTTHTHTTYTPHTHTQEFFNKRSARPTLRYLHNTQETQHTNIHVISGIGTCHSRNQVATTHTLEYMTADIDRYILI
jgi:hypothetical protein